MPNYDFLPEKSADLSSLEAKMKTLVKLGVPYMAAHIADAEKNAHEQASQITERLKQDGVTSDSNSELIALISYLQKLGIDKKQFPPTMEVKP